MDFKQRAERTFTLVFFFATFLALAATSVSDSDFYGTQLIWSDCVSPTVEGERVEIEAGSVVDPVNRDLTDFGFPTTNLSDLAGSVNGLNRICERTYKSDVDDVSVYNCEDEGEYACTIILEDTY